MEDANELQNNYCNLNEEDDPQKIERHGDMDNLEDASNDAVVCVKRRKSRISRLDGSDSEEKDSEVDKYETPVIQQNQFPFDLFDNDQETKVKSRIHISRIKHVSTSSDESDEVSKKSEIGIQEVDLKSNESDESNKKTLPLGMKYEAQTRYKSKRSKLKEKFKSLMSSREHHVESHKLNNDNEDYINISNQSPKEDSSLRNICDTDTSDEETLNKSTVNTNHNKSGNTIKLTSPKAVRMSAKQAMENMQKIKSESNRMLREKEVYMPYHRPKALSLKDIMSRMKPAVASNGKALPMKMNENQLKEYVCLLEQRHKEIIELCKSDTDDEEIDDTSELNKNNESEQQNHTDSTELKTNVEDSIILTTENIDDVENELTNYEKQESSTSRGINEISNKDVEDFNMLSKEDIRKEELNLSHEKKSALNLEEKESIANGPESLKPVKQNMNVNSEPDSQNILLHCDTENEVADTVIEKNSNIQNETIKSVSNIESNHNKVDNNIENVENCFFDVDFDLDDIEEMIENAEIAKSPSRCETITNSPMLVLDPLILNKKPKLSGTPGMVIDLDSGNTMPKKSGIELLKERFVYFSNIKTSKELETQNERRIKPGQLHLKLKQELEDKISEKHALEWQKRLDEEKQNQIDSKGIDKDVIDEEDDIDKIEAQLETEENYDQETSCSESEEEDLIENDMIIDDKPKKKNPLIDDEAEVSDDENEDKSIGEDDDIETENNENNSDESSEEDISESEIENESKLRRGRILKAFEDSDDEDIKNNLNSTQSQHVIPKQISVNEEGSIDKGGQRTEHANDIVKSQIVKDKEDDDLQLAQLHKSFSEDSQESELTALTSNKKLIDYVRNDDQDLGTQTFSILESSATQNRNINVNLSIPGNLDIICESQPQSDINLNSIPGICSGSFSQNMASSHLPESQSIGEDVLALCTGQFYDNQFVSQTGSAVNINEEISQGVDSKAWGTKDISINDNADVNDIKQKQTQVQDEKVNLLESILDELNDPEFLSSKPNKYFTGDDIPNTENSADIANTMLKKRLIIDSDEESCNDDSRIKKTKKKKKAKDRALQISDDETDEELIYEEDIEDDIISDKEEDTERVVEYDSEENEVEVELDLKKKKKRKATDFFEQEAELTSEDEWVGSGDEDERDLDRMEREEGDDEVFHQGKLRTELGQIHMRDVLDQDKREVRLLQELLFEDGDLGSDGRERKFRWRNDDGEEVIGTLPVDLIDSQEEEFQSEEQWRKERHEKEAFLRQLRNKEDPGDKLNLSITRNAIIKANLSSKTMSSLLLEVNTVSKKKTDTSIVTEEKTITDIPSPKKSFAFSQRNYRGSLLSRSRDSLARLAALAEPLAVEEHSPTNTTSVTSTAKRNCVFSSFTPKNESKASKRKADTPTGTPRLIKKMKTKDKNMHRNCLLDRTNT